MGDAHEYARKLQLLRSGNVAATAGLVSDFPSLARELASAAPRSDRPAMVRCRRIRIITLAEATSSRNLPLTGAAPPWRSPYRPSSERPPPCRNAHPWHGCSAAKSGSPGAILRVGTNSFLLCSQHYCSSTVPDCVEDRQMGQNRRSRPIHQLRKRLQNRHV
jgi:hypothetical protein